MFNDAKWETDAGNISNYDVFDRFVYRNGTVESFLEDNGKYFIIAAKGIGKTLLLSYKRYLLEKKYRDKGVLFIPTQHHYVDFIESIKKTLSEDQISKLEDWEYCKKFWELIIKLSVLSYLDVDVAEFIKNSPQRIAYHTKTLDNLLRTQHSVEYILNELLYMGETGLSQFFTEVSNQIDDEFGRINQSVIMFFDRLDNALETAHDSIWYSLQVGLMEAAWDTMRSNQHIKIYLSIRQEAYAKHTSRNANAISASVVKIEYTKTELRELLNHLVNFYEHQNTLEGFLGFETFPNTIVFKDEPVYDFMYRYSIGRPRDFVQFCDMLSKSNYLLMEDDENRRIFLKDKVRDTSSSVIIASLFSELRMLMNCLKTQDDFNSFLMSLTVNILTYSELQAICSSFNGNSCTKDCKNCPKEYHPFCDLYNMGLLGTINAEHEKRVQHFKTPYENMTQGLRMNSKFFLIHPALREYINNLHKQSALGVNYNLYFGILVGESLPWDDNYDNICNINKMIGGVKDVALKDFFNETLIKYLSASNQKGKRFVFPKQKYDRVNIQQLSIYERKLNDSIVSFFKTKKIILPTISVFISYTSVNEEHKLRVEGFVDLLRGLGFDAQMDSSLKEDYPDIEEMMDVGLGMDKVIIVLSKEYKRRADKKEGGVWKEFKRIAEDLESNPKKYIFVSFDEYSSKLRGEISPLRIGNRWIVDLAKDKGKNYSELIAFIKEEKEYPFKQTNSVMASVEAKPIQPFN